MVPRSLAPGPRSPGRRPAADTIPAVRLLTVDIGNSNIGFGLFDGASLEGSWRATSRTTATADELAMLADGLLRLGGYRLAAVEAVAVASVVPPLTESFARAVSAHTRTEPLIIDAAALDGVLAIEIDRPAEAGADRLCNALAARDEFGGPAIVVDLGTSTNFDLVSASGAYIGGAIAPGMGVSLEALVGRASKLPRIDLVKPPNAIGANTIEAMQSGTVNGYIGLVTGLLTALRGELLERSPAGARVTTIATGGYTHQEWLRDVPGIDAIEPDLTLRGIRYAHVALAGRSSTQPAVAQATREAPR
jgi:type III pantothenate kinase